MNQYRVLRVILETTMLLVDNLIEESLPRRYDSWKCHGSSRSRKTGQRLMRYCEFIHLNHLRDTAHKEIRHI